MVTERGLKQWLREVRAGRRSLHDAAEDLRRLPFDDLGFARLDTHRRIRRGIPEAIFCEGKSPQQLSRILQRLLRHKELAILTRLDPATYAAIQPRAPRLVYDHTARLGYLALARRARRRGLVVVVTGGTADLPIAEEAALTLELLGSRTVRLYDVGVAGIHRLLAEWRIFQPARAIVVVAGMEGALASVVAGLVRCPVIAVPTSIGYGASFQGLGPLLTMLNSCAPGVGVVNIDNGFGAACLAHLINRPPRDASA